MSTVTLVEPLARVEGHGGITVEMEGDAVTGVRFDVLEGPRLLEVLLKGQPYTQVSHILSRICAICSVAHSLTSIATTEAAFGVKVTPQTQQLRELLFRGENIESHALHVFLLALPDYLGVTGAAAMAAINPEAVDLGLRLKALGNRIQEVIGGRAIHPVNPILGGMGSVPTLAQLQELRDALRTATFDVELGLELLAELPADDFVESDTTYAALEMKGEYGYFNVGEEIVVVSPTGRRRFPAADYKAITNEKAVGHSYAKHSTLDGEPFMVGALARLTVNRRRVTSAGTDAIARLGIVLPSANPMDNTRAQLVELVMDLERSLAIVEQMLESGVRAEPPVPVVPRAGRGTVVVEAPRGLLVHSYEYDAKGRITWADVITPTAMNAASMEHHFRDTVAQADDRSLPEITRKLELVARAYDPCISCSVHVIHRA